MAKRISELEAHLRQWESGKKKRTAAFTLVPIAAALGVGWYAYDRVATVEGGLDETLTTLQAPAVDEAGPGEGLARLTALREQVEELRRLPDELAAVRAERDAL